MTTITQIEKQIAETVAKETGASVDVHINGDSKRGTVAHFYTEDIDKADSIKMLLAQVANLDGIIYEASYEADEDIPAGLTLIYAIK